MGLRNGISLGRRKKNNRIGNRFDCVEGGNRFTFEKFPPPPPLLKLSCGVAQRKRMILTLRFERKPESGDRKRQFMSI